MPILSGYANRGAAMVEHGYRFCCRHAAGRLCRSFGKLWHSVGHRPDRKRSPRRCLLGRRGRRNRDAVFADGSAERRRAWESARAAKSPLDRRRLGHLCLTAGIALCDVQALQEGRPRSLGELPLGPLVQHPLLTRGVRPQEADELCHLVFT